MQRVYAIGDIHGCSQTFRKLLLDELRIRESDIIYCLGDYVDRGPDSKGVVDLIIGLRKAGYHMRTLRGNHEQIMMNSLNSAEDFELWSVNGGEETLWSFQAETYLDFAPHYKHFFSHTKYSFQWDKFIFVHAGLDFSCEDPFENKEAMLWIRDFEIDQHKLGDKIIVHGHSPRMAAFIPSQHDKHAINLDGGCVYPYRPGYGYLFALEVNSMEFTSVKNVDG